MSYFAPLISGNAAGITPVQLAGQPMMSWISPGEDLPPPPSLGGSFLHFHKPNHDPLPPEPSPFLKGVKKYAPAVAFGVGLAGTVAATMMNAGYPVQPLLMYGTMAAGTQLLAGRDVRDITFSYMLSDNLFRTAYAGVSLMGIQGLTADPVIKALGLFAAGALLLRGFNALSDKIPVGDLKQEVLDQANAGQKNFDEVREQNPKFQAAVTALQNRLVSEKELLAFLGYDPATFDLQNELKHLKVGENKNGGALTMSYYMGFTHSLMLSKVTPRFLLAHEMLHALHHKAMMRGMTREVLAKIPELLADDVRPSFLRDKLSRIEGYLKNSQPADALPDAIRWDGADAVFYHALRYEKARFEAIGSYFDLAPWSVLAPLVWTWRATEKAIHYYTMPFNLASGIWERRISIPHFLSGYSPTPFKWKKMREAGLFGAFMQ